MEIFQVQVIKMEVAQAVVVLEALVAMDRTLKIQQPLVEQVNRLILLDQTFGMLPVVALALELQGQQRLKMVLVVLVVLVLTQEAPEQLPQALVEVELGIMVELLVVMVVQGL